MILFNTGITVEAINPIEIARLKRAGYREVIAEAVPEIEPTAEEQNEAAIQEANKPIGSKKAGKK